jgi:CDP-diacylglycerol--serine O-phosphatidyltransferase
LRGRRRRSREARPGQIPLRAVVPNLVTALAACAGITSIALSSEGRFVPAMVALIVACVCDGMDGRIARLLKASSKLGAELDSLADFVNFGVAPAMFMFFWLTGGPAHEGCSPQMVRLVLGCSLFYALCDCFRLARFNTMLEQPTLPYWKHFFTGVPAPGGCWMVLTPAILALALDAKDKYPALQDVFRNPYFGMFMLLFVGALMASRLPTISLKSLHISRRYQLPVMAALLLVVALLISNFWMTVGVMGVLYVLTVPVTGLVFLRVRARALDAASAKV